MAIVWYSCMMQFVSNQLSTRFQKTFSQRFVSIANLAIWRHRPDAWKRFTEKWSSATIGHSVTRERFFLEEILENFEILKKPIKKLRWKHLRVSILQEASRGPLDEQYWSWVTELDTS